MPNHRPWRKCNGENYGLIFRRVARPNAEQKRILRALAIELPDRLSPDRIL
jgi:hypothetical protein